MKTPLSQQTPKHWTTRFVQEQAHGSCLRNHPFCRQVRSVCTTFTLLGATFLTTFGVGINPAQAAPPKRSDWCGLIWSLESNPLKAPHQLAWVSPLNGASSSTAPNSNIAMPSSGLPTSVNGAAALGIHVQSGTLFAFDRDGNGQLYKYRFGFDTTWVSVSTTGLLGLGSTPTAANINKMTVDGDTLYLANFRDSPLYAISLDPTTGTVISPGTATATPYSYSGIASTITANFQGGDITTDEYGDTYAINYTVNSGTGMMDIYFFKQGAGNTWIYQGTAAGDDATSNYAGAAFLKGDLYVKNTAGKLKKVDLTRSGSGYTGWSNLSLIGTSSPTTDLAACGTPKITINKTMQLYTDAAATTLATDQVNVKTGQYIKYFITAKNTGDAWGRVSTLTDPLPAGSTYVPNSAVLNGNNMNLATYPAAGFLLNGVGAAAGVIPFLPEPDTATLTFVVQVSASSGSVTNRATIAYIDNGLPSDPANCNSVPAFNCGTSPTAPVYPSISGTVWNDINSSITIDGSPLETGTNAGGLTVYGVNASGIVLSKATVNPDGTYTLVNFNPGDVVTVRLSTDASVAVGGTAPASPSIPNNWLYTGENKNGTTETVGPGEVTPITVGGMGTSTINQNFGLKPTPANVVFIKRITAINGAATNPNDLSKNLGIFVDDLSTTNDNHPYWPTGFLKGEINAGKVKPGDTIEYTVYFLNAGGFNADSVKVCDRIIGEQQFNGTTIQLQQNSAAPTSLSSAADTDRATFYASSTNPAITNCNFKSVPAIDNGAVVVNVTGATGTPTWTTLAGSFATGTSNSYGFVRFTTKINP